MPPGVALLDYDNDGDLDVFLVQSETGGSRLYRNDLKVAADGTRRRRQRRLRRSLSHVLRRISCGATTATARSRTSRSVSANQIVTRTEGQEATSPVPFRR
jgi:hypothetical protein